MALALSKSDEQRSSKKKHGSRNRWEKRVQRGHYSSSDDEETKEDESKEPTRQKKQLQIEPHSAKKPNRTSHGTRAPRGVAGLTSKNAVHPVNARTISNSSLPQAIPSPRPQRMDQPAPNMSNVEVVERNKQLARAILARRNQTRPKGRTLKKGTGEKTEMLRGKKSKVAPARPPQVSGPPTRSTGKIPSDAI